jgi:hypothetical protein
MTQIPSLVRAASSPEGVGQVIRRSQSLRMIRPQDTRSAVNWASMRFSQDALAGV